MAEKEVEDEKDSKEEVGRKGHVSCGRGIISRKSRTLNIFLPIIFSM